MDQKKLPQGLTYEKLYQINDQSIWFLSWVLKQRRCNPGFNQQILSAPFTVGRIYRGNGQLDYLSSYKNEQQYGLERKWQWHPNGQLLWWESHWQNGQKDGLSRGWHRNGQLESDQEWQNGQLHGLSRGWHPNGQLSWEQHWQNGQRHGLSRRWNLNGQLEWENHWQNGQKISKQYY